MRTDKLILSTLIAAGLSACGGGGGSDPAPVNSPAQGFWQGTTSTNRTVSGVVLEDGTYWFLYTPAGNPNSIAGVIQGNSTASNGSYSSTNGKDFNLEGLGIMSVTLAGTYTAKASLVGTLTYAPSGSGTFTSTYDATYDTAPSLTAMAGTYSGAAATSAGSEAVSMTVSTTGAISGTGASGCRFTGSTTPRASGKNIFNVSVTFGAAPCTMANSSVSGIAHFDAPSKSITSAALNSARTDGFIFVGVKP